MHQLSDFVPIRDWVRRHSSAFPTFASWEWFARQNRAALTASGQLLVRYGRAGSLAGPELGRVVIELLTNHH